MADGLGASGVTVYGCYGSFCTQKVYLALAEKGVEAQRRAVDIGPRMENYDPWYARLNPRMVVPTLDHGGHIVTDSARIIRYIDDAFDGPRLMPVDPGERAAVEAWIERIDRLAIRELSYSTLGGLLAHMRDRVVMPRRLRVLRRQQRRNPALRAVYQARIDDVQRWVAVMRRPDVLAPLRAELEGTLTDLDARLAEQAYVVGDGYTFADLMATVLTARVVLMRRLGDIGRYPHLRAHYARMRARPRFPADDIAEAIDTRRLARLILPFLAPRLALGLAALSLLAWAVC